MELCTQYTVITEQSELKIIKTHLEEISATLNKLLKVMENQQTSVSVNINIIEQELSSIRRRIFDKKTENEKPALPNVEGELSIDNEASRLKKNLNVKWKNTLNHRKQAYWNFLRFKTRLLSTKFGLEKKLQ